VISGILKELVELRESSPSKGLDARIEHYEQLLLRSSESIAANIIRSHQAVCEAKSMSEKEAYGNNPAIYYALGICGEAGELANNIVKALRNGSQADLLPAVRGELADVIIYSYILAHVMDIDLTELVNEKVEIVIDRAKSGYYGNKLH
jgi:NTP pyrophosphatase (non-canonical NTP hydrolase)